LSNHSPSRGYVYHEAIVDEQRAQREKLRIRLRTERAALPAPLVRSASQEVSHLLAGLPSLARARHVALYAAVNGEIETSELHEWLGARAICVAYPRIEGGEAPLLGFHVVAHLSALTIDQLGIGAPPPDAPRVDAAQLDVILVPGVAFAADGHRLGYGRGYYDAALAAAPGALRIGLCHAFQVVDRLPPRNGDEPVDLIVTPAALRPTGARARFAPEEVLT
jgi:5-formyltetrahydrofolate cyclo-ligase